MTMPNPYAAVTFARHAREQMQERKVSADQAERTIARPHRFFPSTRPPGRLIAERDTAMGNTLRVVYVERHTPDGVIAHIITVIRRGGTSR